MVDPSIVTTFGAAVLGGVVWAVRLEGRVNEHARLFEEREKQADDRHEDLKARLVRIELKLDQSRRA